MMSMFILVLFILAQIILNIFLIGTLTAWDDSIELFGVPIHLLLMLLINIAALLLLAKIYTLEGKRRIKLTELTHEEQFRALVASVRSDRHDFNNHLTVIGGLIKINDFTNAAKYMNQIIGEVKINNIAFAIKNPILASLLFAKMELFQQNNVQFTANIASEEVTSRLSSTDLIRLISNLIDNAYEATMDLPEDQRKIIFEISKNEHQYTIILKNTSLYKQLESHFFEHGYTTKSSTGQKRGFGLSIIKEVTKKYGGTLNLKTEDSLIVFDITFPKGEK